MYTKSNLILIGRIVISYITDIHGITYVNVKIKLMSSSKLTPLEAV